MHLSPSAQLELEADDAMAAIKTVLHEMRTTAKNAADPRKLTAEHPWLSVGVAAAAGFVGAMMVIPSKEDSALKRLERIERALGAGEAAANGAAPAGGARTKPRASIWRTLGNQAFSALKPMLLASITGTLSAKATQSATQYDAEQSGEDDGATATAYGTQA